jgi:branched-chain amino acid transport system substrate-binding protein
MPAVIRGSSLGQMRKPTAVAAVVVVLAMACGGGSSKIAGGGGPTAKGPIKIGVVGPMTGLAGFVGKNMVEGIQLAVEDLNAKGGVLGRQVEFVQRDDEADPAKTTTAVRELIEKEKVSALFGPAGTSNYLSIARIIEDNKVPAWVIMSGRELSDNVNPYAFRAFIPDTPEIEALAEFAAKRYSRIAVITGNDAEGTEFATSTKAAVAKHGKTVVSVESFALDETDFSPILLKVKKANADAIIMGTHLGLFGSRIATAAKNLDVGAKLLGIAGLINYTYPDLARSAADGTTFVSFRSWGHLPRDQWPDSVLNFYNAYVKRFLPEGEYSETGAYRAYSTNFLTYDMVKIWAAAAEQAKSAEPEDVGAELNGGFTYPAKDSVIGVPWTYSADDHDGIRPGDLYFYRWELGSNGKFTLKFHGTVTDVLAGRSDL